MNKKYTIFVPLGLIIIAVAAFFAMNNVKADTVDVVYSDAKKAYEQKNYQEAIGLYEQVLEMEATYPNARKELAQSFIAISKREDAIELLKEGINVLPKVSSHYLLLSEIYIQVNQPADALDTLERGRQFNTDADFEEMLDEIYEQVYINIDHPVVQSGYDRELSLIWENDEGDQVKLNGTWTVEDTEVGTLTESDKSNVQIFSALKTGSTDITVKRDSFSTTVEIEVADQVPNDVTFTPVELEPISTGETVTLTYEVVDAAGKAMEVSPEWTTEKGLVEVTSSSTENSVTLEAIEEGIDTLAFEYQGLKKQFKVKIQGQENIIETSVQGNGTIKVSPEKETYETGESVTFEAVADEGWEFVRWDGDIETEKTDATFTSTVKGPMTVTAIFEQARHDLNLSIRGEGRIVRDSLATTYDNEAKVSLRARADEGWRFVRWTGSYSGFETDITLTMNKDHSVEAVFEPIEEIEQEEPTTEPETFKYRLYLSTKGQGSIQQNKSGSSFTPGTSINVSAVPADGWVFKDWSTGSTSRHITVTMNDNRSLIATFEKKPEPKSDPEPKPEPESEQQSDPVTYSLSTSVVGNGSVHVSSSPVEAGESISVEAIPAEGWHFAGWHGAISGGASASVVMDRNKSITAVFEQNANDE